MSDLDTATQKLESGVPRFRLESLPTDRNAVIWNSIKADYNLTLPELSALQNYASLRYGRSTENIRYISFYYFHIQLLFLYHFVLNSTLLYCT